MAEPAHTSRVTPTGIPLDDGFSTKLAFSLDPDIEFREKSVGQPGRDGGDFIETTTMFNTEFRTFSPRQLKTLTEFSVTGSYDPVILEDTPAAIDALINIEQAITVNFPDGSQESFFGALRTTEFAELVEGEQPEVTLVIQPTNWDPANNVEAGPAFNNVAGT